MKNFEIIKEKNLSKVKIQDLSDLSFEEFINLIKENLESSNDDFVYGIQGLADILKVSKTKANQIKASGMLDEAISQEAKGCAIIVNVQKAKEIYFNIKNSYK